MHGELQDEIDFEPEDELGEAGAAKVKIQKLREELREAQAKAAEYLDGWQRCKADMVNAKKEMMDAHARASARGKEMFVEELIPALDGFDAAMQGDAWQTVEAAWRRGIEGIQAQVHAVLKQHGVEKYGKEGETFDPALHEPVQEIEGGTSHTVARVLRFGYRTEARILRPAQVVLYK